MSIPFPANWIAKKPLQQYNVDTQINNCVTWLPNGNCNSNSKYNMPSASPWTWSGVSGLSLYNPGYDFAGGTSISYSSITATNSATYTTTATKVLGTLQETDRNYNNCNCNSGYGTGVYACYTNCNCNCACACCCACCCAK
jgi:hypothetical protein